MADLPLKLNQALAHMSAGRWEQARTLLLRIVKEAPASARAASFLSLVLAQIGQFDQSIFYARRAATLDPAELGYQLNLANALLFSGNLDEALDAFTKLTGRFPQRPEVWIGLGETLRAKGRHTDAAAKFSAALKLKPGDADTAASYGSTLLFQGRADEAAAVARQASLISPTHSELARLAGTVLLYAASATREETLAAHKRFAQIVTAGIKEGPPFQNSRDPDRPLRVGFVSPELRRHSVAAFLESIFANRGETNVYCYYTHSTEDETSRRLKSLVTAWRHMDKISEDALARQIREDEIDILIETTGLTRGHRLGVFARRSAPVQVTYCGYLGTTGLERVDYRIVDSLTDPPGAERWAVEKLVRLDPCHLCYRPRPDAPDPGPLPALKSGRITFVSFNSAMKINADVISAWSQVLKQVEGSRLLLKCFSFTDPELRKELPGRFASEGIDLSRIEVLEPTDDSREHLSLYTGADLGLDTFPYDGTTTTCEALWMCIPVVTLAGDRHPARTGISLLNAVGLPELVAPSREEFMRIAVELARDIPRLAALRSGPASIRARMAASPLRDEAGHAAKFLGLLRQMWRAWCADPTGKIKA